MSDSSRSGGETNPGAEPEGHPETAPPAAASGAPAEAAPAQETAAPGAPRGRGLRRPRGFEWVLVGVAVVIAWKLWDWRGNVTGPGKTTKAPITLVTSDREDLACGFGGSVGRYRCAFDANGKPWPNPPTAADRLAPYYTTDRQLYLIPGLFEQPALARRYESESPATVPRDKQRRFVARCEVRILEKVDRFKTRWLASGGFNDSDAAWVAEPVNCTVTNE